MEPQGSRLTRDSDLNVVVERIEGLKSLFNERFDAADRAREDISARVDKVDGRMWKVIIGVAIAAVAELWSLIVHGH